jgi:hypothetical protein
MAIAAVGDSIRDVVHEVVVDIFVEKIKIN